MKFGVNVDVMLTHKTITISILEPIIPGMSKDEFLEKLEHAIYSELDLIN